MPSSLNVAPSGISSFSAISATVARSCSLRLSSDIFASPSLSTLGSGKPLLDLVEKAADRFETCEALVRDLDAQPALQRPDDLEHAERIDRQLRDDGRF